jgi:tape measure domain-containing protein
MATERIQIIVTSKGAVIVKRELDSIATSATRAAKGADFLKGALASFVSGALISQISSLADAGTQLGNALTVAGLRGEAFSATQDQLFQIAKDNGQSVNELAGIYQRLNANAKTLNITQDDTIEALKNIAAGFKISSAGANAQAGALSQLQQLLGGTTVQMQEVNSLVDGAYPILQAVARGTREFGGDVGKLINTLREGGYPVKAFFDGLMAGSDVNRQLAADWNLSIGQALTNFKTNLIETLLWFNQTTGAFTMAAQAINFFANNILLVTALLSPLIVAISVLAIQWIGGALVASLFSAADAIGMMITAMGRLLLLIVANPFTALIVGLALVIAYFVDWEKAIWQVIKVFGQLLTIIGDAFGSSGFTNAGITITVNAEQALAQLKEGGSAIKEKIEEAVKNAAPEFPKGMAEGGTDAAAKIKAAMEAGGSSAASKIKGAAATGAASAQATYQALNGVPEKIKGAVKEGGDYVKNEVTGAVEKTGSVMSGNIKTGGDIAGQTMENHITAGGQKAGAALYQNVEQVFANLGNRFLIMQLAINKLTQEINKVQSETMLNNANSAKARAEANQLNRRFSSGGTSSSASSGGYSSSSGGGGQSPGYLGTKELAAVNITNVVDPGLVTSVNGSASGQRQIVNVVAANKEEIQRILGVF